MNETTPAEAIARAARMAGDAFAAGIAASVAARETTATAHQLDVFEQVTTKILDRISDQLAGELVENAPQYTPKRARQLAGDFLVSWAENVAEESPAILAGETARLAHLETARGSLIHQLVVGPTAPRPHLVALDGVRKA